MFIARDLLQFAKRNEIKKKLSELPARIYYSSSLKVRIRPPEKGGYNQHGTDTVSPGMRDSVGSITEPLSGCSSHSGLSPHFLTYKTRSTPPLQS